MFEAIRNMRSLSASLAAAVGLLSSPAWGMINFPDCARGPLANNTVCDVKARPSDRAMALVKAMTISEKLANMVEYGSTSPLPPERDTC